MKKIALIDGYGFVFRAYHSIPPLTRNDGTPVGAVFGFTTMLLKLLASLNVSHIAVIFDSGSKTFRNNIYPEYKANRPPCPEDLIPQFSIVRESAEALNISILEKIGFEADDIIATIAKKSAKEGFEVVIVSSDKDLMQLIDENIKMFDAMKNKMVSFNEVQEKFSVEPSKVLEVLSLIGDSSDNVPGVRGIGPKTASELINQFENLENLYENLDKIKQEKRRAMLEENKNNAFLSKKLIRLDENVELGIEIDDLKVRMIEPRKLIGFLENQGFRSLIYKVKKEFNLIEETNSQDLNSAQNNHSKELKNPDENNNFLQEKIIIDNKKTIEEIHQISQKNGAVIIDFSIKNNQFNFITLTPASTNEINNKTYFFNFENSQIKQQENVDLLSFSSVQNISSNLQIFITDFDKILFDNSIRKIFFNGKNFLRFYKNFLRENNLKTLHQSIIFDDVNLINYLINSSIHNSLRELININLNLNFEELGFGEKIDKIEDENSQNIFENDQQKIDFFCLKNLAILQLYQIFAQKITELKLYNSYLNIELPLIDVLAQIEFNGVKIDVKKLSLLSNEFAQKINKLAQEIYQLSGCEFNIASSKQLSEVLFDKLGIESSKKSKKTKALSTNVKVLEDLALDGHEIANKIIEYRKFSKLKNTYCDALPKQISKITNRIHTTLSNTATLTGRLSSITPNLQNIPIKTIDGKKIRECFIASENCVLISADYSQIELRILAHLAKIPNLIEAFKNNKDIHRITASQIFGIDENLIDEATRSKAKAINFGIIYGISAFGLARQLKISNKEAGDYIKSYFEKYAGIKEFMNQSIDFAKQNGYVSTISSRKCFIKEINNKNPIIRQEAERQAINAPIQGSAADIIKKAMIRVHQQFLKQNLKSKLILQIHDELLVESTLDEIEIVKNILQQEMSNAFKLEVDLKVDFSVSNHWG
jgi:DNA polymerase I